MYGIDDVISSESTRKYKKSLEYKSYPGITRLFYLFLLF